jgi:hypothetical protein
MTGTQAVASAAHTRTRSVICPTRSMMPLAATTAVPPYGQKLGDLLGTDAAQTGERQVRELGS